MGSPLASQPECLKITCILSFLTCASVKMTRMNIHTSYLGSSIINMWNIVLHTQQLNQFTFPDPVWLHITYT